MKIYASTSHLQSIVDSSISDPDVDIFGIRAPSTTIGFVFRNARIGATFFRFLLRYHVRNRTFVTSRSLDRKRKSKRSTVGRKMKTARMPEPTRSLERPIFPNRCQRELVPREATPARKRVERNVGRKLETLSSLYGRRFDRAVQQCNEFRKTESRPNGLTPDYPFSTRPA